MMKLLNPLDFVLYLYLFIGVSLAIKRHHSSSRNLRLESAGLALTSMMGEMHHLTFEIVIVKNDSTLDKLVATLLNKIGNSSISIKLSRIKNVQELIYFYGVSYIVLSKEEVIYKFPVHGDERARLEKISNVNRTTNTYKESIFLNYAYEIDTNQMTNRIDIENNHRNFQLVL